MPQTGLPPMLLPGARAAGAAAPQPSGGAAPSSPQTPDGVESLGELLALAEAGLLPTPFVQMLQQLQSGGTPLPATGSPLPGMAGRSGPGQPIPVPGGSAAAGDASPGAGLVDLLRAVAQSGTAQADGMVVPPGQLGRFSETLSPRIAPADGGAAQPGAFGGLLATAAAGTVPSAPGAAPGTAMLSLPQRVGDPGWQQALGERLLWLAGREQQVAELRLNPPNLGPLEVRLVLQQDHASVAFVSQHAAVREALEQAVPRLREMLGQQDLQLVQVDVGERQLPQRHAADAGGGSASRGAGLPGTAEPGPDAPPSSGAPIAAGRGLIDLFA